MKHLYYRDLAGIGYDENQIKAIAATDQVTDGPNDQGQMYQRPGRPSDPIPGPFPNEQAARAANNGALPPDLSLIVKAREGGPDYVYAILTGFPTRRPASRCTPGHELQRILPRPSDRHAAAAAATARSPMPTAPRRRCRRWRTTSSTFLAWAAEPESRRAQAHRVQGVPVPDRRRGMFYAVKRKVWAAIALTPPMTAPVIGIIGGSGLYDIDGLADNAWRRVESPWGTPSDEFCFGRLDGQRVVFLPRHGRGHLLPPSELNFRANIDALKRSGVTDILSLSAVGSLREDLPPGDFVIVDQFIDRTFAREKSFFGDGCVAHVSMAHPVCAGSATRLSRPARRPASR